MFFLSNDWLKTRIHYYERIVELKWDIWFYFNAVDAIMFGAVILFLIIGVILYAACNINHYIDPFLTMKNIYTVMHAVFIVGLLGIYVWFMKKEVDNDKKMEQIGHILFLSICLLLSSIMAYCFCNWFIANHMTQVYACNTGIYQTNMPLLQDFSTGFNNFFYKTSFYIAGAIPILIFILSTYVSATWYKRLKRGKQVTKQTDILFDEEENVKM
ncbi:MAG: hypothetical protein ACLU84_02295 [Clostridia bacterium]